MSPLPRRMNQTRMAGIRNVCTCCSRPVQFANTYANASPGGSTHSIVSLPADHVSRKEFNPLGQVCRKRDSLASPLPGYVDHADASANPAYPLVTAVQIQACSCPSDLTPADGNPGVPARVAQH